MPDKPFQVYYNEIDPDKAAWLRELICAGIVAQGEVDERSIADIRLDDLRGFTQCHFFAGIGVWSYALRLAGWPDDRPVWTGSCPCPSFSAAGKGGGFRDARHLWPDWARLIGECKPATVFGEQADDAIGYGWLDLVQTDLERANYAVGKAVLGACSVGAPHIRQRLYFVANAARERQSFGHGESGRKFQGAPCAAQLRSGDAVCRMEHADSERLRETRICARESRSSGDGANYGLADANGRGFAQCGIPSAQRDGEQCGADVGMGDTDRTASTGIGEGVHRPEEESNRQWFGAQSNGSASEAGCDDMRNLEHANWRGPQIGRPENAGTIRSGLFGSNDTANVGAEASQPGYVNGFWRDADWILRKRWNRDDWEWCPTEPGTFPLAHGAAARVLRLRGYGDAIVPQVAAEFIRAYHETVK